MKTEKNNRYFNARTNLSHAICVTLALLLCNKEANAIDSVVLQLSRQDHTIQMRMKKANQEKIVKMALEAGGFFGEGGLWEEIGKSGWALMVGESGFYVPR